MVLATRIRLVLSLIRWHEFLKTSEARAAIIAAKRWRPGDQPFVLSSDGYPKVWVEIGKRSRFPRARDGL